MTCSVPLQYLVYFSHFLPHPVRDKLGIRADLLEAYLFLCSKGLVNTAPLIQEVSHHNQLTRIQALTVTGMYVVHSPSDGEALSQPALHRGIPVSNPYFDMDLIEFSMGIPFLFRISMSQETRSLLTLQKRTFRALAARYLPKKLVYRKKGFTVSFDRNERTKALLQTFPTSIEGIPVNDPEQRIAAELLRDWCESTSIGCQDVRASG